MGGDDDDGDDEDDAVVLWESKVRLLDGAEEAARWRRCWRKRSPIDCFDMVMDFQSSSFGLELLVCVLE